MHFSVSLKKPISHICGKAIYVEMDGLCMFLLFFLKKYFLYLSSYLAALGLSFSMQTQFWYVGFSPLTRMEPHPPALGARSLGQWTTRKFLVCVCFKFVNFLASG